MVKMKKEATTPLCPHCEQGLEEIIQVKRKGLVVGQQIYCCPHCSKLLGFTI
jgi:transposase-like protein